jgi:hypothetical protein
MSETACGRFAGLRGMPSTTESVMSTALIRINTANSTAKKEYMWRVSTTEINQIKRKTH